MTLLFADQGKDSSKWIAAFQEHLNIKIYPEFDKNIEFVVASKLPLGLVNKLPNLKCIACTGAGVNGILNDASIPEHVQIIRIVDNYLSTQLVHYCTLSVLSKLRNWTEYCNPEYSKQWQRICPTNTEFIKVGIMGLGEIGKKIGTSFLNLGFQVKGLANSQHKENYECYTFKDLDLFLKDLDFLICILPLTEKTKNICNQELFSKLNNCYFINVGRGDQVNEDDLIQALDNNNLSGACLDVFRKEPLDLNHIFWNHPKILITPHIAAKSDPKYLVPQIIENYQRFCRQEKLHNLVDRNRGY